MGVKVEMVTGDQLAIAIETAKKLDMGTDILDATTLGDEKQQETKDAASPSKRPTASPRSSPNTSSTLSLPCKASATSSA